MGYMSQEMIEEAKSVDLVSFLRMREPGSLVRVSTGIHCLKEHDSLRMSNGKWYWFSRGIGGHSAVDFLVKVRGYRFLNAVQEVLGREGAVIPSALRVEKPVSQKRLLMPKISPDSSKAEKYLVSRGIHPEIIRYCLDQRILFQTEGHNNILFLGYDEKGIPRHGSLRSMDGPYKGDLTGSDKRYSFSIPGTDPAGHLHVFEAATDLLSFATLEKMNGRNWRKDSLLSLAGVFASKREGVVPVALGQYLRTHHGIRHIHLHLDNDEVGKAATEGIRKGLEGRYGISNEPPKAGKDVNEYLVMICNNHTPNQSKRMSGSQTGYRRAIPGFER